MNHPRYWRYEPCAMMSFSNVETSVNTSKRMGKLSSAFNKADTYAAYTYGWWISIPGWKFISELLTAVQDGDVTLKGSHRMGTRGRKIFLKTSEPHSLMTTYIEWAYFQPDPSRWTVPLRQLNIGQYENKVNNVQKGRGGKGGLVDKQSTWALKKSSWSSIEKLSSNIFCLRLSLSISYSRMDLK